MRFRKEPKVFLRTGRLFLTLRLEHSKKGKGRFNTRERFSSRKLKQSRWDSIMSSSDCGMTSFLTKKKWRNRRKGTKNIRRRCWRRKSLSSWINYLKTLDGLTINIIWEAVLALRRYSWLAALTIWTSFGNSRWIRMESKSTLRSKRTICWQKRLCLIQIHWVMIWIIWSFPKQRLSNSQLFPRRT